MHPDRVLVKRDVLEKVSLSSTLVVAVFVCCCWSGVLCVQIDRNGRLTSYHCFLFNDLFVYGSEAVRQAAKFVAAAR